MEFIKKNIGPNKVHITINTNKYEESIALQDANASSSCSKMNDIFSSMGSILETFRALKTNDRKVPFSRQVVAEVDITVEDPLLYCIYTLFEPSASLMYKASDINQKIRDFKVTLIKNLTHHYQFYKNLLLKGEATHDELVININDSNFPIESRKPMIVYLGRLLGRSIAVEDSSLITNYVIVPNSTNGILIIDKSIHKDGLSNETMMKSITGKNMQKYLNNNLLDTIDKLRVDDLKVIANNIEIETFRLIENKKKHLLKNELKAQIISKFEDKKSLD